MLQDKEIVQLTGRIKKNWKIFENPLTYGDQKYIILMTTKNIKRGWTTVLVKMGRPTDNPKPFKVVARITAKQKEILDSYCESNNCNQMQAIRDGIDRLEEKK